MVPRAHDEGPPADAAAVEKRRLHPGGARCAGAGLRALRGLQQDPDRLEAAHTRAEQARPGRREPRERHGRRAERRRAVQRDLREPQGPAVPRREEDPAPGHEVDTEFRTLQSHGVGILFHDGHWRAQRWKVLSDQSLEEQSPSLG